MWWDAFGILHCLKQGDRQIEHLEFNSSWNHRAFDTIVSVTLFSKYAAGFLNTSRLYDGINYSFQTKTKPLAMGISTRKGRYLRQWIQKIYYLAIQLRRYEGLFKNDIQLCFWSHQSLTENHATSLSLRELSLKTTKTTWALPTA